MYFATTFEMYSLSGVTYDTIQIRSASGEVYNSNKGDYMILPDSLVIRHDASYYTGASTFLYWATKGTLYKQ